MWLRRGCDATRLIQSMKTTTTLSRSSLARTHTFFLDWGARRSFTLNFVVLCVWCSSVCVSWFVYVCDIEKIHCSNRIDAFHWESLKVLFTSRWFCNVTSRCWLALMGVYFSYFSLRNIFLIWLNGMLLGINWLCHNIRSHLGIFWLKFVLCEGFLFYLLYSFFWTF